MTRTFEEISKARGLPRALALKNKAISVCDAIDDFQCKIEAEQGKLEFYQLAHKAYVFGELTNDESERMKLVGYKFGLLDELKGFDYEIKEK